MEERKDVQETIMVQPPNLSVLDSPPEINESPDFFPRAPPPPKRQHSPPRHSPSRSLFEGLTNKEKRKSRPIIRRKPKPPPPDSSSSSSTTSIGSIAAQSSEDSFDFSESESEKEAIESRTSIEARVEASARNLGVEIPNIEVMTDKELKKWDEKLKIRIGRQQALTLMRRGLVFVVVVMEKIHEYVNIENKYLLEGWSEEVFRDLDSYDTHLLRIYDHYNTGEQMHPMLAFGLALGGSACMYAFTRSFIKAASMPGKFTPTAAAPPPPPPETKATTPAQTTPTPAQPTRQQQRPFVPDMASALSSFMPLIESVMGGLNPVDFMPGPSLAEDRPPLPSINIAEISPPQSPSIDLLRMLQTEEETQHETPDDTVVLEIT